MRGGSERVDVNTFLPEFDAIRKVMLGSHPHVQVLDVKYISDRRRSGDFAVDPDTLVLIWRPAIDGQPMHDWRATIEGIKEQQQATRAPRLTDALPLLIEHYSAEAAKQFEREHRI